MYTLHMRRRAQREVARQVAWYDRVQDGLGKRFADAVEYMLNEIESDPIRNAIAIRTIRFAIVPRFPFSIYYRIRGTRINVLSVYHHARDPAGWENLR